MNKLNASVKKEYFKNLDLLRFVFAVIIVIFHMSGNACANINNLEPFRSIYFQTFNMNKAVECFFVLSGFLLIITDKADTSFVSYMKNKFFRLSPTIAFCAFVFLVLSFFDVTKFYFFNDLFSVFFINGLGIGTPHGFNGELGNVASTWFVCVLIWVSLFYRYLLKLFGEKVFVFVTFCTVIVTMYWLTEEFYKILPMGILRGLYSIGAGCLLGLLYKNNIDYIKNNFNSIKAKIAFSLVEISLFTYFILTMCLYKIEHFTFGEYVVMFSIVLFTFVIKKGVLSKFLEKNCFAYLGKFAYSIFVSHCILLDVFKKFIYTQDFISRIPNGSEPLLFLMSIICCIILGVVVYFLVEKPCYQFYLKNIALKNKATTQIKGES